MNFRKYSIVFKLKCVEMIKTFGIYNISKYTRLDKKCIKYQIKNTKNFKILEIKKLLFYCQVKVHYL